MVVGRTVAANVSVCVRTLFFIVALVEIETMIFQIGRYHSKSSL